MRLYLDSADVADWRNFMPFGTFYGITTNPLLTAKAGLTYSGINWLDFAKEACASGAKEFHAQIFGSASNALKFSENSYRVGAQIGLTCVVEIPLTEDGIRLAPQIKAMGGSILMTACYDAKQMTTASALCAKYIAPYFGRMYDAGLYVMAHMSVIHAMSSSTQCQPIIAALRKA